MKPQRVEATKVFKPSNPKFSGDRKQWVADIRKALYASKIISYTQGYMLMRAAAPAGTGIEPETNYHSSPVELATVGSLDGSAVSTETPCVDRQA